MKYSTDFIVIGSGIAGLNAALTLSKHGKVLIITKKKINDAATKLAQGGIAAVTDKKDKRTLHEQDTMKAGVFHNNKIAVRFLVEQGKNAIEQLMQIGVKFDKKATLEAAHSFPRIHHATDITGHEIEKALVKKVLQTKNISILEYAFAIDIIAKDHICFGVQVIKNKKITSIFGRCVVLATGGAGQLYKWTTNPPVSTGDGIAIGNRAGAKLTDLEFVQFHPTALKENSPSLFLLSEALRGEGAVLVDKEGKRFINELAARDIVARAIFAKQKEGQIYLDIRHKGKEFIVKRFPNIDKALKKRNFDLSRDLIPVTPAAHFLCGGIKTDLYGRTSVKNLFAYGEVAATGVHGANRLASNSLLEGMVFSSQIELCINNLPKKITQIKSKIPQYQEKTPKNNFRKQIQEIMWNYVGIVRSQTGLRLAIKKLKKLDKEIIKITKKSINKELTETKNMIKTALLITQAAKRRKTSLGTHYIIE